MTSFQGFPAGKVKLTPIPAPFFSELLPRIDHLGELKITLYAMWFLEQQEGAFRYMVEDDFASDEILMAGLGSEKERSGILAESLRRAVERGTLLKAEMDGVIYYFLNSARGRSALRGLREGAWLPEGVERAAPVLTSAPSELFRLYEENIGPLTPLIADDIQDAEKSYPAGWIEDAIHLAVQKNARNWRYIAGILRSWKERGRDA